MYLPIMSQQPTLESSSFDTTQHGTCSTSPQSYPVYAQQADDQAYPLYHQLTNTQAGSPQPQPQPQPQDSFADQLGHLHFFLATAPTSWQPHEKVRRFLLPSGEHVSCILHNNLFHITGTDIVRALLFRFQAIGRPVRNLKKFEEGIFSDLRNLKPGVDASLESNRSEFLEWLYKHNCVRTQKKQKVFYWFSVPWDQLFYDGLERDLKREALGMEPTTVPVAMPPSEMPTVAGNPLLRQHFEQPYLQQQQIDLQRQQQLEIQQRRKAAAAAAGPTQQQPPKSSKTATTSGTTTVESTPSSHTLSLINSPMAGIHPRPPSSYSSAMSSTNASNLSTLHHQAMLANVQNSYMTTGSMPQSPMPDSQFITTPANMPTQSAAFSPFTNPTTLADTAQYTLDTQGFTDQTHPVLMPPPMPPAYMSMTSTAPVSEMPLITHTLSLPALYDSPPNAYPTTLPPLYSGGDHFNADRMIQLSSVAAAAASSTPLTSTFPLATTPLTSSFPLVTVISSPDTHYLTKDMASTQLMCTSPPPFLPTQRHPYSMSPGHKASSPPNDNVHLNSGYSWGNEGHHDVRPGFPNAHPEFALPKDDWLRSVTAGKISKARRNSGSLLKRGGMSLGKNYFDVMEARGTSEPNSVDMKHSMVTIPDDLAASFVSNASTATNSPNIRQRASTLDFALGQRSGTTGQRMQVTSEAVDRVPMSPTA